MVQGSVDDAAPDDVDAPTRWRDLLAWMPAEHRRAWESYALLLTQATSRTEAVVASILLGDQPPAMDPMHVLESFEAVSSRLNARPGALVEAQTELLTRYADLWRRTLTPEHTPDGAAGGAPIPRGDKRFSDAAWSENPAFDFMKSSYLISSEWLNGLVERVEGVDPAMKRRAAFATKLMTDAFSPSNFLFSNPVALREAAATHGESLVRGAEAFARDVASGGGELLIRQVDPDNFIVGKTVAASPGKVVFQNDLFQLLQFSPSTDTVYETPLLIIPPWINKYYILDLKPQNSMIAWLVGQGYTLFVVSWINPEPSSVTRNFADYMTQGAYVAAEQVRRQCGVEQINAVGYCIGGTLLGCTLAHMADRGVSTIASATFFAAQQDFSEAGDLLMFVDDVWIDEIARRIDDAGGVLPGKAMAETFNLLRSNDLIWSFYVNNYLLGKPTAAFDLLFWNADQTRMPGALHLQYLRDFYRDNKLAKAELVLDGVRIDLRNVKIPVYLQSSREDHIAPMRSVYKSAHLFGGAKTFTLAGSGHIAGVVNAPAARKYQHWIHDGLPPELDDWLAQATSHPGSWWPHWDAWLGPRSGGHVPARDPTAGPLTPLEDAPGSYVRVRSEPTTPDRA